MTLRVFQIIACLLLPLAAFAVVALSVPARANEVTEFRLKAAFIYNFIALTEWPNDDSSKLQLCIVGGNPFGDEIAKLNGRMAGTHAIVVEQKLATESIKACNAAYIVPAATDNLPALLESVKGRPVLLIGDTPGGPRSGVALNLVVVQDRVGFEVNLPAARDARLTLNSKLLRVATKVYP